jgi:hypothetical protein
MSLFETKSIPPIPFLAELREEVLKHSLKRMPKWKFRFAPDIVVQLQPKPTVLLSAAATASGLKPKYQHFVGVAVMGEGVTGAALKQLPKRPCPAWWQIKFEIYTHDPGTDWLLHRTSGAWQAGSDRAGIVSPVERVVAALRDGYFTASMPPKMAFTSLHDLRQSTDRSRLDGAVDRPGMRGHQHTSSAVSDHRRSSPRESKRSVIVMRRRRKSEEDKALAENAYLLRAWWKWHAEQLQEALTGAHRDVIGRLMAELTDLRSADALVAFIETVDWSAVDANTRLIALHEINSAICKVREKRGLDAIDDALPGEPPRAFQVIRSIIHE